MVLPGSVGTGIKILDFVCGGLTEKGDLILRWALPNIDGVLNYFAITLQRYDVVDMKVTLLQHSSNSVLTQYCNVIFQWV